MGGGHFSVHWAHVGQCRPTRLFGRHRASHVSRFRQPSRNPTDRRRPVHTNDHGGTGKFWAGGQACASSACISFGVDPDDLQSVRRGAVLDRHHPRGHHGNHTKAKEVSHGLMSACHADGEDCQWTSAGSSDSVLVNTWGVDAGLQADHWFGDAIQSAVLDIEDVTFRDVRTSISSRHRATGFILGAEGYKMLRVKYNDSKDFQGSWMLKLGGTWSPGRTLNTDFSRLVQSTVVLNGVVAGLDTSSYEAAVLEGQVPQKWTLGGWLVRGRSDRWPTWRVRRPPQSILVVL